VQETQGAADDTEAFLADMEITGGGVELGVAEESLDNGDLDAVLKQVGGEAVTEFVDAGLGRETRLASGAVKEVLGRPLAQRRLVGSLGEEPPGRPVDAVPGAEFDQQVVAERDHAHASALGMADPELMTGRVDVLDLDMGGFGEPQAASVDGHEEGPGQR